ncbi:hypothetical protein [Pseudomonas cremoricolorata]|uniref:Morphogenetic protein n=1 Tax=Pseudomonas cremoricolorata TaxID=157783 RepID=A0A089WVD4_9PSED|nr:hypothetical protein [Pseudomonas cremoricolorata]AIR90191.1 hypothetical protein LK03_13200 [Pseudomonas cremoricolorata]AIR90547.1 hypothetical protein LK03_15195 [Pseudomonas cremoricolorata]
MSQAKERPILFSAPMVRAILDGRKTVTRRPARIQPRSKGDIGSYGVGQPFIRHPDPAKRNPECPYGRPGDRLWVREAWAADAQVDSITPRDLSHGEPIAYPADGSVRQTGCAMISQGRGRPSIHMPRWASRILLEITDVRVERLQHITEDQAKAEGVRLYTDHAELGDWWHVEGIETYSSDPRKSFELLWTGINGAESWEVNPWVWVVEFKRIQP